MRIYQKPPGEDVGSDQIEAMEEAVNCHLEQMFNQVAKRNLLDFGVGRTTTKANTWDTRLDAQRRDCDARTMFHAGRALEVALHVVYARGANRIMGREYPGVSKAEMDKDRRRGHGLRLVYDRITNELGGRDMKGALEVAYQRALHKGVIDISLDGELIASFMLAKDTPFRETSIGGMADGVEYTLDHSSHRHLIIPTETKSKFSQMPYKTFEQFLEKADAAYYEGDVSGTPRNMRWTDYFWRDHEYGRAYTVVGVEFFARLAEELVSLSHQRWVWDIDFAKRWLALHQDRAVNQMEALANQNLEEGTEFADVVSLEKAMARHEDMSAMLKKRLAMDVTADFGNLHTKWAHYTTREKKPAGTGRKW